MKIIGVSAKKQGGKSTMVNTLLDFLPRSCIVRFADFLKEIVLTAFTPVDWNWIIDDLESDENKNRETPCGFTVRRLLQIVGTDWFRNTYNECWITAYKKRLISLDPSIECVLTPDVRFPNELKVIQEMGGLVIRLTRAPYGDQDQHESETALDRVEYDTLHVLDDSPAGFRMLKFDYVCDNRDMSMEQQKRWVKEWLMRSNYV